MFFMHLYFFTTKSTFFGTFFYIHIGRNLWLEPGTVPVRMRPMFLPCSFVNEGNKTWALCAFPPIGQHFIDELV